MCNSPLFGARRKELFAIDNGEYLFKEPADKRIRILRVDRDKFNLLKSEAALGVDYFEIPCGQCLQCRLDYAREWANRIVCEQIQSKNCLFVTLTYADENLPLGEKGLPSLDKKAPQKFMKDLRRYCEYHYNYYGIRDYIAGEYGDKSARPHYHACLFNLPDEIMADMKPYKVSFNGDMYYNSSILSEIWGLGHVVLADLCYKSAAYVARYVVKKQKGLGRKVYESLGIVPEFSTQSRRPGIGREFFELHKREIYENDRMYLPQRGECRPSKYYDKLYTFEDPATMEILKGERLLSADRAMKYRMTKTDLDQDSYLRQCEEVLKRKLDKLIRPDL